MRKLNLYVDARVKVYRIVSPMQRSIYVYFLEEDKFDTVTYTFKDEIPVGIYDGLRQIEHLIFENAVGRQAI